MRYCVYRLIFAHIWSRRDLQTLTVDLLISNSNQFIFVLNHRRSQDVGGACTSPARARIENNFAQLVGLRYCYYRHYA